MYLIIIAFYSAVSGMDCYSQSSQLNLFADYLEINLRKHPGTKCNFPSGVMVQLQFPDPTLNIAQIFTDFIYENTTSLIIRCGAKCAKYDEIISSTVLIDSPELTTVFSIGSVLNVRKNKENNVQDVHLTVSGDQICVIINKENVAKDLTAKQVQLIIHSDRETKLIFDTPVEKYEKDQTSFCYTGKFQVPFVDMAVLTINGKEKGITVSQNYTTFDIKVLNQPDIFTDLGTIVFSSYLSLGFGRNKDKLKTFVDSADFSKASFDAKIRIDDKFYYISGIFTKVLFESNGNIVCALTNNEEECNRILTLVQQLPAQEQFIVFYFQVDTQLIIQEVTTFRPSCFTDMEIIIFSDNIEFDFQKITQQCLLELNKDYTFKLGYFDSPQNFAIGSVIIKTVFEFQQKFDNTKGQIIENINQSQQDVLQILRTQQYVLFYVFNENEEFLDQIISRSVGVHLRLQLVFYCSISVLFSGLITVTMFLVSIHPRPQRINHKKLKMTQEEI
ncbi:hypothetical protein SS50377_22967 [Spironucleus salmonicida]|uniref:Transmembrane protein n=1 Tax=Spironucleus salmonicida TaxID=348837 RepID=V6LTL5_9EUKA|nr:hypothetical protein SS50377_22967 [Spironucleus salmonicida]|eukprot:EST47987.1 Hypothetical protein SS50377_11904 [Spironucleus salmonicida]